MKSEKDVPSDGSCIQCEIFPTDWISYFLKDHQDCFWTCTMPAVLKGVTFI